MLVLTDKWYKQDAARAVGARWDGGVRAWVVDNPSQMNSRERAILARLFPDKSAEAPPDTLDLVPRPVNLADPWAEDALAQGYKLLPDHPNNERLYPYQRNDLAFLRARVSADGGAYIGWDRGMGKTFGVIQMLLLMGVSRAVIVAPNSAKELVLVPELGKWDSSGMPITVVGGTKIQREKQMRRWAAVGGWLLVHYEALRLIEWSDYPVPDAVVCDEAHRLAKGHAGRDVPQFYKALKRIKTEARVALSGSILVNSPEDIFGAAHWLFPGRYRSRWRDWNDRWFEYVTADGVGRTMVGIRPDKLDEMRHELAAWMCVRRKQDELKGLPERIEQTILVDLSPAQRKVYNDLARRFYAELPNGDIVMTTDVLSRLIKLRQVATGLDLLGETFTDSTKLDVAEQLVEDNAPNKTVVFTWHRATADALSARLWRRGLGNVVVHGGVPVKDRMERLERFKTDPARVAVIATIKTLGESVNLQVSSDVVFVEHSWTPADMDQAADRVYRIGQQRRVTITSIVARETVDEWRVIPTLTTKAALRKELLG